MDPLFLTPGAGAAVLARKHEVAMGITAALYRERPELSETYGAAGRERCLEDMHHNLEHLAAAAELEVPEQFASYIRWVDGLLRARGVPTGELARTLELAGWLLSARLEPEHQEVVSRVLQAGLDALGEGT